MVLKLIEYLYNHELINQAEYIELKRKICDNDIENRTNDIGGQPTWKEL